MEKAILLNNPIKNIVIPSGLVPKGAYDNSTDYAVGDYVTYLGTSYVMFLDAPAGTLPTDTTYWQILASKGNTGDSSPLWELDGTTLKPTDTSYLLTLLNSQSIYSNSDDALIKNLSFYKSRGTYASPTVINPGDYLGEIVGYGYDGSDYIRSGSIRFKSAGTIAGTRVPSRIEFYTSTNATPSVETLRGYIDQFGYLIWQYGGIQAYNAFDSQRLNIVTTSTDAFIANNSTAATSGAPVQISPRTRYRANVWNTTTTASETSDWIIENLPTSGTTPSSLLKFGYSANGGTYSYPMTLSNTGVLTTSNYIIAGGHIIVPTKYGIYCASGTAKGFLEFYSSGTLLSRNVNDANPVLAINNVHASSTGNILDLQWQGTNRISFTKNGSINLNTTDALGAGTININGTRIFHCYSDSTSVGKNLFVGENSGNFTMAKTGSNTYEASKNTGVGYNTLTVLTTGYYNTAIGYSCGSALTKGANNVLVGYLTGSRMTTGQSNMGIGRDCLSYCVSGNYNTAIGNQALNAYTGSGDTAIGCFSLLYNTTGTGLVAVGYEAGKGNVKGTNNTYLGYQAGYSGTTVVSSITITNGGTGYTAGDLIVDNTGTGGSGLAGTYTVNAGTGAIETITITNNGSGYNSAPVVTPQAGGSSAVLTPALSSAISNVAVGSATLSANITGSQNVAIGYNTLSSNTKGHGNMALGESAVRANLTGNYNTGIGYVSLRYTTGYNNLGLGAYAGANNTTGNNNVYIGNESAWKSGVTATGSGNVFMGYQTGINNTASYNVFIGYQAGLSNTSGGGNTYVGYKAGYAGVTAQNNSVFGENALLDATGSENSAFGQRAGSSLTTGTYNTFLGKYAGYNASQKVDATNSTAIGYGAYTTASNQIVIGNESVTQILCGQDSQAEVKAGKLETTVAGEGIILKSPDGTRYKITVANDGTVTSTAV